MHKNRVHQTT